MNIIINIVTTYIWILLDGLVHLTLGLGQLLFVINLPIIQIIILHLSTPLFKRKLPIIPKKADKMQMKYECDQNVHVHFGQQVLGHVKFLSLL